MSTKKPAKSPTEKSREAAIAEIQQRIDRMDDVAPGGEATGVAVAAAGSPVPPAAAKKGAKGTKKTAKPRKAGKPTAPAKPARAPKPKKEPSKLSGLDAAAKILAEAEKPMNLKEIMAEVFKKKLWHSDGATPEATVSAAIGREIRARGGDSRFKKTGRGLFVAAGKAG